METRVFYQPEQPERASPAFYPRSAMVLGLVGFVGLCLLVYAAGSALAASAGVWFALLLRPPGILPGPTFSAPIGLAYASLGVAGWRVWWSRGPGPLLRLWGWQLLLNALWAPCLFGLHSVALGLALAVASLVVTATTLRKFATADPMASGMMVPSLCWIGYATYLCAGTWWLNSW